MPERATASDAKGPGDLGQLVCTVREGPTTLGYVVIDSTVAGRSRGGLRMLPDVDEAEMRGLARAMTLKYGFLGLPQGGAKAGVRGNPDAPESERRARLVEFAKHIAPLLRARVFAPDTDMGTSPADVRDVLRAAGVRLRRRDGLASRSGHYTALTVLTAAREAARHLGGNLAGASVAVEGFGRVGSALAGLLVEAGARVVAISTARGAIFNPRGLDIRRLVTLAAETGSGVVDLYHDAEHLERQALLELPVLVLFPCARHDSVRSDNAPRVRARIICPGANNPVTPDAERLLVERGVLCLPDFVTNSGGALGGTMAFASIGDERIAAFIDGRFGPRVAWLLDEADRRRIPAREVAVPLALQRHAEMRRRAGATAGRVVFEAAIDLYRRGWLPARVVGRAAWPYFERALAWPAAAEGAAPRRPDGAGR